VAKAQTASNLKELSDTHATDAAPVSLSPGTDQISSEIRSEGPTDLAWNAASRSAAAGDPLGTQTGEAAVDNRSVAEPVLMAHAGDGPLSGVVPRIRIGPNCATVTPQFPSFSPRFNKVETGFFVAEFDAVPGGISGSAVGISPQPDTDNHMAAYILFADDGTILAQNYDHYDAATVIRYTPGVKYHFVFSVSVPAHIYSVQVTPDGGTQQLLAFLFKFHYTELIATSLDYWDLLTVPDHTLKVCNFKLS
jgi:hypothetical protein